MVKKAEKPKMGRPPLPPGKKRGASMGFRPTPTIRENLEEAARANGRSMSQEVEARLEHSFVGDGFIQHMLGSDLSSMMALRSLANAIASIEGKAGKSWRDDWAAREQVSAAFEVILDAFGPQHPVENRLTPQGRLRAEKREHKNQIAGQKAAVSSIRALLPGYVRAIELIEGE